MTTNPTGINEGTPLHGIDERIPGSHTQLRSFPCSPARAFIPGHQPLATPDRYHPAGGAVLTIQYVCWQINAHFHADAGVRSGSA